MNADPRDDPQYRAAMEANEALMSDQEKSRAEQLREQGAYKLHTDEGEPSISAVDAAAEAFRRERQGMFRPTFESVEEMMKACENAKPVDEYQQQVLNAMKTQQTNILLIFGPGHGQTMTLPGPPAEEIVWQEATNPTFAASTDPLEDIRRSRQGIHRYRLNDEMESAQMEEVALYVHHERCCERRFGRDSTSHYQRRPRDVFNKPYLR